jgi:hypothetical protein
LSNIVKDRVLEFLRNYGDRGYLVLKIALEIALDPSIDHRLGDFSYKYLIFKLRRLGINYNPANLLRIMEKDYGLIERSYNSSSQKWWSFVDLEAIRKALLEYSGMEEVEDPRLRLLLIKYRSLEPSKILNMLRRLSMKTSLNPVDKRVFKDLVFNEMDKIVKILEEMMGYEDVFDKEIKVLQEILGLAEHISAKIESTYMSRITEKVEKLVSTNEKNMDENKLNI